MEITIVGTERFKRICHVYSTTKNQVSFVKRPNFKVCNHESLLQMSTQIEVNARKNKRERINGTDG